ncbi:tautomerase family protein [Mycetocola sp. JXN-3]|uniref:tautomerase family protein n=1 Tax=Mycetocola sp. JXN-3 TaxID=2116510 RepID=UPI00165D2D99|nr:tautomerase family protein [Mycetocola sp. JXN-3]
MAQIIVYGLADTLRPRRQTLSDAVHAAAVAELGLPEAKRFHRFVPLDREDFIFPTDRSENYTIIEVSLFAGRSTKTKKRFIRALFTRITEAVGIEAQDVEITLTETPRENWGIRGLPGDELTLNYAVEPTTDNAAGWFAVAPLSGQVYRPDTTSAPGTPSWDPGPSQTIRLMNEYGVGWPLWGPDGLTTEEDFPQLSPTLRARLKAWAEEFNTHFDHEHGWRTRPELRETHAAEGGLLTLHLTEELGARYGVQLDLWES